jgi:nucleotide-binding universal stress UspA family protein
VREAPWRQRFATVPRGSALEEILAFADEVDADAVVVGASGRGRMASAIFGDVTMQLVQRSSRPVVVVTGPR